METKQTWLAKKASWNRRRVVQLARAYGVLTWADCLARRVPATPALLDSIWAARAAVQQQRKGGA